MGRATVLPQVKWKSRPRPIGVLLIGRQDRRCGCGGVADQSRRWTPGNPPATDLSAIPPRLSQLVVAPALPGFDHQAEDLEQD